MEGNLQFVAIIVTVLLAVGGAFWTIMTTMNKGFAEIRRDTKEAMEQGFAAAEKAREQGFGAAEKARETGFAEAEKAREKGFAEAEKAREVGFAEAAKARETGFAKAAKDLAEAKEGWKSFAKAEKAWEQGFAEAEKAREKGFGAAERARETGFAAAERARDTGFAAAEKNLAEAKKAWEKGFAAAEKGFAEAKEERREIKDDMNRRFDAVETRIARLEAPYFQRRSEDQGVPVERVAEPRPLERYPVAGGHAERSEKTRGLEVADRGESDEGSAEP